MQHHIGGDFLPTLNKAFLIGQCLAIRGDTFKMLAGNPTCDSAFAIRNLLFRYHWHVYKAIII